MKIHWNNKGRIILCSVLCALCSLLFALLVCLPSSLQARVTGECSNCHTMHNSQDGQAVAYDFDGTSFTKTSAPKGNLLIYNCLGCHSTTGSGPTGAVPGAPIVYNTSQPGYGSSQPDGKQVGLAAGNFYWTTEASASGQSRGHSLAGIPYVDDTEAPSTPPIACGGCHTGLGQGCQSCHLPAHHKGASSGGWADADAGYYRFLGPLTSDSKDHKWGVRGYEDPDWQEGTGSSNHNEYSGEDQQTGGGYQSISRHCGCHKWTGRCPNFKATGRTYHQANLVLPDPIANPKWTGYDIDDNGTVDPYSPMLPIARKNIESYTSPSETVAYGGYDTLTCLTCHRAHASPYNKMLRWDNTPPLPSYRPNCKACHSP